MAIKRKPYVYDAQLKRMLVQLMSNFAGYTVQTGNQRDGLKHLIDVPVIYADASRVAGYEIAGSENFLATLPVMSLYMTRLAAKKEWRHSAQHYEKFQFWERARDPDGNLIVNEPGRRKIVERYMPVPYDMEIDLCIWASNNDQLYQLVEMFLIQYNPDVEIQLSNSPADWAFLTTLFFGGEPKFEKAIPAGTDPDPLYIATLPFNTVIWMSAPAKVYDAHLIKEIIVDFKEMENMYDFDSATLLDELKILPTKDQLITSTNL